MIFMKKTALSLLIISSALSAFAQEWQHETGNGEGYSFDTNNVYTDSRGFTAFSGLNLSGVKYSGMESNSINTLHANRYPVMNSDLGLTSGAPSVFAVEKTSISNSDFSKLKISGTSDYDLFAFYVSENSSLVNVDFSGSSFNVLSNANRTSSFVSKGVLRDVNFSGSTFVGFSVIEGNVALFGSVENADFSNSVFKSANADYGEATPSFALNIECNSAKNVNLSGSTLNSFSGINISSETDTLIAHDVKFLNVLDYATAIQQSGSQIKSMDFRGSTVSYLNSEEMNFGSGESKILTIGDVYLTDIKNSMLGDGVIYTYSDGDVEANRGLVLSSGEKFTVSAHEVSAKLTVNSTLDGGEIEILDGGIFEIADNVTLTLSGDVGIVLGADAANFEDIFLMGEGATIVMSGYETNEEAQAAFIGLFKDTDGNGVDWSLDSVSPFVAGSGNIPEPSTYAAIIGALALAFAAYRRRK